MSDHHLSTALVKLTKLTTDDFVCGTSFALGFLFGLDRNQDVSAPKQLLSATRVGITTSVFSMFVSALVPYPFRPAIPIVVAVSCFLCEYRNFYQMIAFIPPSIIGYHEFNNKSNKLGK